MKKYTIAILLVAFSFTTAHADVVIQDANNVIIAGQNVGNVVDACINIPAKKGEILYALNTYLETQTAERKAAEKLLADTRDFAEKLVARAKAAAAKGDGAELQKIIAEAETPAALRKRVALEKQKAEIEAKLAELPE